MIGETIGNFRVVRQLGRGGMGEVWLAEHKDLKTRVAVKILLPQVSADTQHVQRFFNEAIAVSKIKHAGIVKIFDSGFLSRGEAYLVMELLEGETLTHRIQRSGRLLIGQLADVGRQIASVLEATHAEAITHRDLKPDNVFLVRDAELASGERVKLLDFGIAKLGDSASAVTGTGAATLGTPAYMAPEQWRSTRSVDARADVYSLGCVIYEMAVGRPPFPAASIAEACEMHLHKPPPSARRTVTGVPQALDDLITRMLAKDPAKRPSMREVKAQLVAIGEGQPSSRDPTLDSQPPPAITADVVNSSTTLGGSAASLAPERPKRTARRPLVAAGVVLVCAAGVGGYEVMRAREDTTSGASQGSALPRPEVSPIASSAAPQPEPAPLANPFVTIEPPGTPPGQPLVLGVPADEPDTVLGFRPERRIHPPNTRYAIQAHEVTWSEIDPWLSAHSDQHVDRPGWATDPVARARLPATGVEWDVARVYCESLGGSLPTEEQWEYAARGKHTHPNPWGDERVDLVRTHAYAGADARPAEVMSSSQDRTPDGKLFDLAGNVQEWTIDLWRADKANQNEKWVEDAQTSYRAVRGLPLGIDRPNVLPTVSAAYREPLCARGPCMDAARTTLMRVGFRCAHDVSAGK
jgi:eukaryotic-like serine/threonine-protein kinase